MTNFILFFFLVTSFFLLQRSKQLSVYNSQDQLASPKQQREKNIEINTKTVQPGNGIVSVTITLAGTGNHQIEIKTFNAKTNFTSKQVSLSGNKTERIQLELNVADQNKPYVAVIVDKNTDLRKEVVGAYVSASILAKK